MSYVLEAEVPRRSQWEANSSPNQAVNCGPTSASWVADYYRDAVHGIEATRDLATLANGAGTSAAEQSVMLARRGVPNTVGQPTMAQLTSLVSSGRRPVMIGLDMSKVPAAIRGHTFAGIHSVVARRNAVVNGVPGKIIMDPNFGYGHTPDPTNGNRFYPDSVLAAARPGAVWRAIIPNAAKETTTMPYLEDLPAGYPAGSPLTLRAGVAYPGWSYNPTTGAKLPFSLTPAKATSVQTTGKVKWAGEPLAFYVPRIYVAPSGYRDDAYLLIQSPGTAAQEPADPPAPVVPGPTPPDPAVAQRAAHEAAKDVAANGLAGYAASKYPAPED